MFNSKKRARNKKFGLFLAILFVLTIVVGGLFVVRYLQKKEELKFYTQSIQPYYDKKVFEKPKDVKQSPLVILQRRIRIPIVMYHYVEYVKDAGDTTRIKLNINPFTFENELKSLTQNGYSTYFVKDVPAMIEGGLKPPEKSVVLTFDDGYEDFYTYAFPLLKKYNVKATIYIVYDFIGRKGFMNDAQLREIIASNLVEIGSHTLDHLALKQAPVAVARAQIIDSKKKLEDRFGITVETFAYPYGSFGQEAINLAKEAGYTAAVSVIPGVYQIKDNLFYLSRVRAGMLSGINASGVLESLKK